jgi:hypothetical protein
MGNDSGLGREKNENEVLKIVKEVYEAQTGLREGSERQEAAMRGLCGILVVRTEHAIFGQSWLLVMSV